MAARVLTALNGHGRRSKGRSIEVDPPYFARRRSDSSVTVIINHARATTTRTQEVMGRVSIPVVAACMALSAAGVSAFLAPAAAPSRYVLLLGRGELHACARAWHVGLLRRMMGLGRMGCHRSIEGGKADGIVCTPTTLYSFEQRSGRAHGGGGPPLW